MVVGNPLVWDYPLCMWKELISKSLGKSPGTTITGMSTYAQAAVALLIRPDGSVLFIRRAEHENDPWSGHMALPGGRVDPDDAGPEGAVRREVREEIGLDLGTAQLLGRLDQVASPDLAPRVCVTPFVFALPNDPALTLSRAEVSAVHWYDMSTLVEGTGRGTFPYNYQGTDYLLPCIDQADRRIWGMTLRIVDDLLQRLKAPTI